MRKHTYKNGFHTTHKCADTDAPFVVVERAQRNQQFTGHVIPCGDRNAAEHISSELFFTGPFKDVTHDIMSAEQFDKTSRYQ